MSKPRLMQEVAVVVSENVDSKVSNVFKDGEYLLFLKAISEELLNGADTIMLSKFLLTYEEIRVLSKGDKATCMKLAKELSKLKLPMNELEKKEILETYKWIKVKKFVDNEELSWEDRYQNLEKHHLQETNFLIDKIREIVKEL